MKVRFDLYGDDYRILREVLALVEDAHRTPDSLIRVKLKSGREVFGKYATMTNVAFVVENAWSREAQAYHGWQPGEHGLIVDPCDVEWLEYVSKGTPGFPEHSGDKQREEDARGDDLKGA